MRTVLTHAASQESNQSVRELLQEGVRRLDGPLCLAVVGRVSSGKSTLVNALVGRVVSPTAAAEKTRMLVRLRHGPTERIDAEQQDGSLTPVSMGPSGQLPDTLPQAGTVRQLHVQLPTSSLPPDVVVLDTPGLSSGNDLNSARTRAVLQASDVNGDLSGAGPGLHVDALLLVLSRAVNADDVEHLRSWVGGATPLNALGVLTRVDQLGGRDPLRDGSRVGASGLASTQLRNRLACLVPVAGLLAEATGAGTLDGRLIAALQEVAAEPESTVLSATSSDPAFVQFCDQIGLSADTSRQLTASIGMWGVRQATGALREGVPAWQLRDELSGRSGIGELQKQLKAVVFNRRDELKSAGVLMWLHRVLPAHPVRAQLQSWMQMPEFGAARDTSLLVELASGRCVLPDELHAQVTRLLTGRPTPNERFGLPQESSAAQIGAAAVLLAGDVARWAAAGTTSPEGRGAGRAIRMRCADVLYEVQQDRQGVR